MSDAYGGKLQTFSYATSFHKIPVTNRFFRALSESKIRLGSFSYCAALHGFSVPAMKASGDCFQEADAPGDILLHFGKIQNFIQSVTDFTNNLVKNS
ncbi:hypothetical protein [uncultured Nostoc sp.]|uniref:hypothetical protein n=1 Tax=uncultured Nostoc sp. TaxID=340711 RepID=UPI0035C9FC97